MDDGMLESRCYRRNWHGDVWAVAAALLSSIKGKCAGENMPSIAGCTGGAQLRAPRGTCHTSPQSPSAWLFLWGDPVTVGDSWGHPAPTPGPGLVSKPLCDVCSPGNFSADFLSHGLSALGAPAAEAQLPGPPRGHSWSPKGHSGSPRGLPTVLRCQALRQK